MKDQELMEINSRTVIKLKQHKQNPYFHTDKQQVFIIGCKGVPAAYGGFETFVDKLTEYQTSKNIRYHIACIGKDVKRYEYNGAKCFSITVPEIGAAKAVYYDIAALQYCINYCRARPSIDRPIFYILACRIGPFIWYFKKQIEKLNGVLYVNPDGHEWKRAKWNFLVRRYWKISEKLMVKHADLLICDSKNIEKYIQKNYVQYNPKTTFIAYGAETIKSHLNDNDKKLLDWYREKGLMRKEYYLVVGRFVPENNYETMIKEFMRSKSKKDFVIITTVNNKFLKELERKLGFKNDKRIKFVGTVYDQDLLKKIRENAYGYLHGHEVGGTNPSLLEALGSTDLNLLFDVGFNQEVAEDSALYWSKDDGNLARLIDSADGLDAKEIEMLGKKAKSRVAKDYNWEYITVRYEKTFMET